jgi:6-phosphogluconolactonase (cycloisomerase 2 family)
MTFQKWGQGILATAVSAGLGLGLASCGESSVIDYVYLLSSKNATGQINVYYADSKTGALTQMQGSPYSAGGADPVGLAVAPSGKFLYVINQASNTIVPFSIGSNAALTALSQGGVTTPGSSPVAVGINQAGTFLYVVDLYQPGFSASNPGTGAVVVYPIAASGMLGNPVTQTLPGTSTTAPYYPIGNAPTAISVLANGTVPANNASGTGNYIYVTDQLTSPGAGCTTGQGAVRGFSVNGSGVLAPVVGSPFCAGVSPSAIASTPIDSFLYVTDSAQNEMIGYQISSDPNTPGALTPFIGGPIATGTYPDAITVDQTGQYIYVANRFGNSIQGYSINQQSGIPASTGTYGTDAYPQCIIVEPALDRFVYTADFEGFGATGYQLNPNTGALTGTENSPYGGSGQQTCIAATPNGNHPLIHVQGTAGNT